MNKRTIPWEPDSGQVEVSAVAVDAPNGVIWMTDWVNGNYIYRYDLATGRYAGKLHLRPVPQWQQGIAAFRGSLYITADDGDADQKEVDRDSIPATTVSFMRSTSSRSTRPHKCLTEQVPTSGKNRGHYSSDPRRTVNVAVS